MKLILLIIFISINSLLFSQEKLQYKRSDIYILEDSIICKKADDKVFSGIIDFIKRNGRIISKEIYENGYLVKEYEYYNKTEREIPFKETYYFEKKLFKIQKEVFFHYTGEIYSKKYYNIDGQKILEEGFENDKLVYSCEFLNNKKHGKEFCSSEKDGNRITNYINGKKLK